MKNGFQFFLIFKNFQKFSKNAWRMILFLLHICHHTLILYKTAEKPIVMWLFTQNCIKSTVLSLVSLVTFYYQDNNKVDLTAYWRRPYCHADSDIQECSCWQQPVVNIQHLLFLVLLLQLTSAPLVAGSTLPPFVLALAMEIQNLAMKMYDVCGDNGRYRQRKRYRHSS